MKTKMRWGSLGKVGVSIGAVAVTGLVVAAVARASFEVVESREQESDARAEEPLVVATYPSSLAHVDLAAGLL